MWVAGHVNLIALGVITRTHSFNNKLEGYRNTKPNNIIPIFIYRDFISIYFGYT